MKKTHAKFCRQKNSARSTRLKRRWWGWRGSIRRRAPSVIILRWCLTKLCVLALTSLTCSSGSQLKENYNFGNWFFDPYFNYYYHLEEPLFLERLGERIWNRNRKQNIMIFCKRNDPSGTGLQNIFNWISCFCYNQILHPSRGIHWVRRRWHRQIGRNRAGIANT